MKANIVPAERPTTLSAEERADPGAAPQGASWLAPSARRLLLAQLEKLEHGELTVLADGVRRRFGKRSAVCDLAATVEVLDPQFWVDVAFGGSVGAGEAYIHGSWRSNDLTAVMRIMVVNEAVLSGLERGWAALTMPARRVLHALSRNSRSGSRRNIAAHYDLGNELFQLFLDETLAYSCGVFASEQSTLREASVEKFDRVCRKLALNADAHVLEIGTGWGGFALHAAGKYGCRVTTTTISEEQHAFARERVAAAGLGERIRLLRADYRDLEGRYDRIVSIEMIEAVGHRYLDTYFACCNRLLAPDGAMLLQAITLRDQLYERALRSVDFIQKFVFPGSFIPSVAALTASIGRASDLRVFHLEDIGPHYATTLRHWRQNFLAHLAEVKALGYPDTFVRLWEYYLCYCEGGFAERQLGNAQMLLVKPGWRGVCL